MSAPFRITATDIATHSTPDGSASASELGTYLEKLTKMIPAEVIALYVVGSGIIPDETAHTCSTGLHLVRFRWSSHGY